MCGRINLSDNEGIQTLMAMLGVPLLPPSSNLSTQPSLPPRWNVSPSATLGTLVADSMSDNAILSNTTMRWGLEAPWSEPGKTSRRLINARSETLLSKPTFRNLAKHHRTVVPVNGFYEWKVVGDARIPYYVQVKNLPAMLLAAVYQPLSAEDIAKERLSAQAKAKAKAQAKQLAKAKADTKSSPQMGFLFDAEPTDTDPTATDFELTDFEPTGAELPDVNPAQPDIARAENASQESDKQQLAFTGDFAVVTTEASSVMADIHHRSPVMLNVEQAMRWLYTQDPAEIKSLTSPESVMAVTVRQVSRAVNSSRNDGPECISPAEADN